ncbi:hypothetical protein GUJ93_ZPchr0011g28621 [Zizania palustris]|uniref:Uncharacterized protein n=1 Tax=Zizania palustris TaxID=103762 RepID=A0A8J6BQ21_ZIZPA|nr:hypothetical protein GUJ93_ZPchr0011g28621 [Zizania palustris]
MLGDVVVRFDRTARRRAQHVERAGGDLDWVVGDAESIGLLFRLGLDVNVSGMRPIWCEWLQSALVYGSSCDFE